MAYKSIVVSVVALCALAEQAVAINYHVDCSASSPGAGTQLSPFNSLSQANGPTFEAGDVIAFKTGTTCVGTFSPKGSGSASSPIWVTKYTASHRDSRQPPIIDANGTDAAVRLTNQDHWKISDLSLTNPASDLAARQGIHVTSSDGTTHTGILIEHNIVSKVAGQTNKATHSADFILSCGILVDVSGAGSRYDDVLVQMNEVNNCGGGGIKVRIGEQGNLGENIHVTKNNVDACGGDGILISYGEAPLIDYNVASNLGTGIYPWTGGNFAGMWVLGDNNPTISHNVVYGSIMSVVDSEAFDCDWGNTGNCTVEYNYSHDNAGGAFLNCDGCGPSGGANQIVRYNIFENDCRMYSNGDNSKLYFYNNVMYCSNKTFDIQVPQNTYFTNNIFVGNNGKNSTLPARVGIEYSSNLFQDVKAPTADGISTQSAGLIRPGVAGNTLHAAGGYRLGRNSPALHNGKVVPGNGGRDFFGDAVSPTKSPNRGAYEGLGV